MGKLKEFTIKLIEVNEGRDRLKNAKISLMGDALIEIIVTLIVVVICVGIMYLRFRVFGR